MTKGLFGKLTFWKVLLGLILAAGAYAAVVRFVWGLGAATNLSDAFPWGLWIGFDMLVGVGLAAGGFVIAATVHVFRMEKYEEIARPTILTAFLGYLLVIVALLFDLGRPWNIWHPIIMWNPHSVMFEVGWCVMLYTTVLALEFSPLVFERFGWKVPLRIVRKIYVPLVILGVLLSTMHQSSLGTLYVIAADKLHGLWYTPFLPVFFFLSAVAGGLSMTIFESYMSYRAFGKRLEADLLQGLGRVAVVVLGVYAVWRTQDLYVRGNLGKAFDVTPESVMFWGEAGLGVILPMILFAIPRVRRNENGLFFAAVLTIMGFIVNRLNVAITGMAASSGVNYFPSILEICVTLSIVGAGFTLFAVAVKYLPIFPEAEEHASAWGAVPFVVRARPAFGKRVLAGLWVLLLAGFLAVGYSRNAMTPTVQVAGASAPPSVVRTAALRLPEDFVFPAGKESPGRVTFSHRRHVDASSPKCGACHNGPFRLTVRGRPVSGEFTRDRIHEGDLCASCHNGKAAFSVQDACSACHQ
ncbi:MAG: Ni/Fe-hydrogenase cytochrome b subunit [Acidobacteriia bacterium]|nr:Ni/Fe-hydrogenase cytochrome b subunit [Terriglobia bacterium]